MIIACGCDTIWTPLTERCDACFSRLMQEGTDAVKRDQEHEEWRRQLSGPSRLPLYHREPIGTYRDPVTGEATILYDTVRIK